MTSETPPHDLASLRIKREHKEGQTPGRPRFLIPGIIVLLLLLSGAYFLLRNAFSAPLQVETASATLLSPAQAGAVLTASGYVVAQQKASVASKGTGRLVFLGVEEGDRVRKGEIIARLEDQDMIAALDNARAGLEVVQADSTDAVRALERQRTLFASNLSSRAELDGAEARFQRVLALIRAAEAGVRSAAVALENTRIRAPFDGTVLTKDADVGEVVAPFASSANSRGAVVTMADMNSLEVEADVSESNIMRIQTGQRCEIMLDAYPDRRYPGVVHKIVPTADRAKATVLTRVRFRERDDRVLPEMSAKVTFLSREQEQKPSDSVPILTVPSSAVVSRDGRSVVLLVRGTTVVEIAVRTGERFGDRIEIREGLTARDLVVINPPPDLRDGAAVQPR